MLVDALSPLGGIGSGVFGGEGAIYLWAQLPEGARMQFLIHRAQFFITALKLSGVLLRRTECTFLEPVCMASAECKDDEAVVEWLVRVHGVCLIPGSSCGMAGYIRVAYANLQPEVCREAAARLWRGLTELCSQGMSPLRKVPLAGITS